MPWVAFDPTVPVSERARTVHALDRSATVTGKLYIASYNWILVNNEFERMWNEAVFKAISSNLYEGTVENHEISESG
jgi:hypothetical protein